MTKTFLGLFAAATLFTGVVRAADLSTSPQERATAYQSAVRSVLIERGWRITRDQTGDLTAERPSIKNEDGTHSFVLGAGADKHVRLRINFRLDAQGQVTPSAFTSISYYNRLDPYNVGQPTYRPFAYSSPKLTQEYLDIMAEAKSNTATRHGVHADAVSQNKVALK